jgi:hypothetical protein
MSLAFGQAESMTSARTTSSRHASQQPISLFRPGLESLEARDVPSVTVRLDYTYDTSGFFQDPARRAAVERAVAQIAPLAQDNLAPIVASGVNTWQAQFYNPASEQTVTLKNFNVAQNEIVVFINAANMGGSELGLTTSGGYSATGTRSWLDLVKGRGQAGAISTPQTDYSTWGGMITFDTSANWNFSPNGPAEKQYDFTSVATHEFMHIFGFGLGQAAFTRHISGGLFQGPNALAVYGSGIPVIGEPADHFARGVMVDGQESVMQPSISPGKIRSITALERAVLDDIGWDMSASPVRTNIEVSTQAPITAAQSVSTPPTTAPATTVATTGRVAEGTASMAVVRGASGELIRSYLPYGANFTGGVRVTMADVTGDGTLDLITASGPGITGKVNLYDGVTGNQIAWLQPFETAFTGGLYIAAADLNNDGKADLVVTPDQGGGAVVTAFDGAAFALGQITQWNRFFGLDDPAYRGGLRPALGDINGDGTADLVVSAGFGGGPRVALMDGKTLLTGQPPANIAPDFFAFESDLRNGVYVTIEDLNGDGLGDVIAGAGPGGGPRMTTFSGRELLAGSQVSIANFFVGDVNSRSGVRVATTDVNNDGQPDLIATSGNEIYVYSVSNTTSPYQSWRTSDSIPADGLSVG